MYSSFIRTLESSYNNIILLLIIMTIVVVSHVDCGRGTPTFPEPQEFQ